MCDRKAGLPQPARIIDITEEGADVKRLVLDAEVVAEPGQFVMTWLPGVNEKPFSLAGATPLTLIIARVGPFTQQVHALRPGDTLWWRGPYGQGFHIPPHQPDDGELLLVGGGYGVAPLLMLAERSTQAGWPVRVAVGARTRSALFLGGRLSALGCALASCTEDGSYGRQGLVTQIVREALQEQPRTVHTVYGCGPEGMLEAVCTLCAEASVPCELSYERYMKCGFGVCGSCARNGLLVCRDGPVFRYSAQGELLTG